MPGVLTWILQQLTDVQHSIASSEIGIENILTISSIVKVSYFTPTHAFKQSLGGTVDLGNIVSINQSVCPFYLSKETSRAPT